jgi:hypothetical protein
LTGCTSDSDGERLPHTNHPSPSRGSWAQCLGTGDSSNEQGFYVVREATGKGCWNLLVYSGFAGPVRQHNRLHPAIDGLGRGSGLRSNHCPRGILCLRTTPSTASRMVFGT